MRSKHVLWSQSIQFLHSTSGSYAQRSQAVEDRRKNKYSSPALTQIVFLADTNFWKKPTGTIKSFFVAHTQPSFITLRSPSTSFQPNLTPASDPCLCQVSTPQIDTQVARHTRIQGTVTTAVIRCIFHQGHVW